MLAAPGVDTTATSRTVRRANLVISNSDAMIGVIKAFEDQGLLRKSMRPGVDPDAIKMVSDRLMYRWDRLAKWLTEQRRNSERRLQVLATARLWDRSERSAGYLFTDKKSIDDARQYIDSSAEGKLIREFVGASDKALTRKERTKFFTLLSLTCSFGLLLIVIWVTHEYLDDLIRQRVFDLQIKLALEIIGM